jgi:hypothetical protein
LSIIGLKIAQLIKPSLIRYMLRRFDLRVLVSSGLNSRPRSTYQRFSRSEASVRMSNRAAFVEEVKGQIVVRDADISEPGEKEVLVKVHACAIQPADAKVAKLAMVTVEYPAVLGSPVAGVVEQLGPGVTNLAVGDRIVCGTKIFVAKKSKYGGLQRFSIVDESETVQVSAESTIDGRG